MRKNNQRKITRKERPSHCFLWKTFR